MIMNNFNLLRATVTISLLIVLSTLNSGFLNLDFNISGMIARQEFDLLWQITWILLIIMLPTAIAVCYVTYKYRAGNKNAKYEPNWKDSAVIERTCIAFSVLILVVIGIIMVNTTHSLDPYQPIKHHNKTIKIQVLSLNWKWLFFYPEQGIATVNYIRVPIDTPVQFEISAVGSMTSFIIPELVGQVYAMSGMKTQLHMIGNKKGTFEGRSVNYSGPGFSDMVFQTEVTSKKDFDQWVDSVKTQHYNHVLDYKTYKALSKNSIANPVEYFGNIKKALFRNIYMSYMIPIDEKDMDKDLTHQQMNMKHHDDETMKHHDDETMKHHHHKNPRKTHHDM